MKILILGHKGMLGHMVKKVLTKSKFKIQTIEQKYPNWDSLMFKDIDFIVNCVDIPLAYSAHFRVSNPILRICTLVCKFQLPEE